MRTKVSRYLYIRGLIRESGIEDLGSGGLVSLPVSTPVLY